MIKFLDLRGQYLTIKSEIDEAIEQVLKTTAFIGGEKVRNFEREFAEYQHASQCVGVGNGTDALEIAIEALGLPPGSEIIVPANSFIASSEAVTRAGHHVVFADVNPDTYLLDVETVSAKITSATSAILVVHLYGRPCDMGALATFAASNGLRIIEDSAQAHGAEWQGRRVGALGDVGTFSFYPGKNLGAYGDGGAVVTNDSAIAERVRKIANHGRLEKYTHEIEGRNSRLDGLQAAVLSVKLRHLDGWIDRRNAVAQRYLDGLRYIDGLTLPEPVENARHAFHLFVVRTEQRAELEAHLHSTEIQTGRHYPVALPKQPAYASHGEPDVEMFANQVDSQLLSLPIGEHLTDLEADKVIESVRNFYQSA